MNNSVLLVRPAIRYVSGAMPPVLDIPIGLLSIAAVLEQNSIAVDVYDAACNVRQLLRVNADNSCLLGDDWDEFSKKIAGYSHRVIGITASCSTNYDSVAEAVKIIKKIHPDSIVVVGGNYPSACAEKFFLEIPGIDALCIGEGEYVMLELAKAIFASKPLAGIEGVAVRGNMPPGVGRVCDLDQLPFPAYHLVNMDDYFTANETILDTRYAKMLRRHERAVSVITSRGCPFNCIFCSVSLHMGRVWRGHSFDYVLKHIDFLVSHYGVNHIHFDDDNLLYDQERFSKILDGLIARKQPVTWDTPNGLMIKFITRDLLKRSVEAGCICAIFAVESANARVQREVIGKVVDIDKLELVLGWCNEFKLDHRIFFVVGFPDESPAEIKETLDFALRAFETYDSWPCWMVATAIPGTRLEGDFMRRGLLQKPLSGAELMRMTQGEFLLSGEKFTATELKALLAKMHHDYSRILRRKSLLFFLLHPVLAMVIFMKFIRGKRGRQDIYHMFYRSKNALLRKHHVA